MQPDTRSGNLEVAAYLLDQGADINSQSLKGKTPLHRAIYRGKGESIKFLIQNGAEVNIQDKHGDTPLHLAARFNYNIVAKLLIDYGANPNLPNNNGKTALNEAAAPALSWQDVAIISRNKLVENDTALYSKKLGSIEDMLEAKSAEQLPEKLQPFEEKLEKAISKEMPGSQMHKALISLKDAVECAIKDAQEGRLDRAEAILKALVDAREGKSYTAEAEVGDITNEPTFSADDQNLAGKSPASEDINPESTDQNFANDVGNNQ